MALALLLLTVLVGFFVAAPMDLWRDSSRGAGLLQPSAIESSLSTEQYVAAKVRAWRQFVQAQKHCDGFDDASRNRCLQQARHERAAAISVVNASFSEAKPH
jgi:hypothetical protein